MSSARPELWILVASSAAALWAFTRPPTSSDTQAAAPSTRRAPALSALPGGASLVARVDMPRVRRSALGASLTGSGRELSGLGSLSEVCGFDPTEQIEELVIALSGEPTASLGIVATGDFDPNRIIDCAASVISRRGGTPAPSRIGAFSTLRDRGRAGPELAVRAGGPVVVGEGAYFRAMLDAADGQSATLLGDQAHSTLRAAVGGSAAFGLTFVTRPDWLTRWVGADEAAAAPLGAVRAGALRVDLEPSPRATLLFSCPAEATCRELSQWVEGMLARVRAGLAPDPVVSSQLTQETNAARLTLTLDERALGQLVLRTLVDRD